MIKNIIYFYTVAIVFITNILILLLDKDNIGFGSIIIAVSALLVGFSGLILWFLGFFYLRRSFALLPKAEKLVKNGPYKFMKHPIYVGITLAFAGLAIAKGSAYGLLFALFITTPMNIIRALNEERLLKSKYKNY